jgi:hypothetical protein
MPSSLPVDDSLRSLVPPTPESEFSNSPQSPHSHDPCDPPPNRSEEPKSGVPQKRKAGRKPLYKTAQERRDRNRRAQLAFRARRSDYLAKLEETCRSYELIVAELQESNRAANDALARERNKVKYLERILSQNALLFSSPHQAPTFPSVAAISLPADGNTSSAPAAQQGVSLLPFLQVHSLITLEQQISPITTPPPSIHDFLYPENYLGMLPLPMIDLPVLVCLYRSILGLWSHSN